MKKVFIFALSLFSVASQVFADEKAKLEAPYMVAQATGATLPQNVTRVRLVSKFINGDKSFNKDSKKVPFLKNGNPTSYEGVASAFVLEHGVLDNLSLQVVVPYLFKNDINFQGKEKLIKSLAKKGDSHEGVGDIEIGALYNWLNNDVVSVSTGLGLRLPTGNFKKVNDFEQAPGAGFTDLAARVNLDVQPLKGLWLSLQEQVEMPLTEAKRTTSESTLLLTQERDVTIKKDGLTHKGYLKANLGLDVLSNSLKAVALNGGVHWKLEADQKATNQEQPKKGEDTYHYSFGGTVDAMTYGIPVALEVDYKNAFAGTLNAIALNELTFQLKGFYKF